MRRSLYIGLQLLFLTGIAVANPSGINLSGKISLQATNTALTSTDVDFKIRVLSPDGCILYSEKFLNVDLSSTAGVFNLTIGNGTALYNAWDATLGTANSKASLIKVFSNGSPAIASGLTQYPGEVCAGGAYTPTDGDTRKVVIEFDPTGQDNNASYVALSPFHRIRSVPYAMLADHATDSDKLGGVAAAMYAKTSDLAAAVPAAETDPGVQAWAKTAVTGLTGGACGAGKVLTFNGTTLDCVVDGGGGGGSTAIATNTVAGTVLVDTASYVSLNLGTGALDVKNLPTSKITGLDAALADTLKLSTMPASCAAGEALVWTSPSNTFSCYAVTVDTAHVTGFDAAVDARIAADTTKLPVAGGTMTGNINMSNNQLSNVGYVHLQNKAADPAGLVAGNEGFVWYNSTDKQIKYYNGTAINALPAYTGACADGEVLKWNNTTKVWACAADAGASGGANATQIQGVNVVATAPTTGQFLKYNGTDWAPTSMPVCTADQVMIFNGTGVATCTAISGLTNSAIAAAAAIARTKLASGTADHVLINDATGVMSSEAQLAISRGGTGIGTAPTADQVLVGNASSGYDLKTLTAGTGVTISTAGSAVTINATATAPADSAYDTKGVVGFQTDAATSGMVYSSAGIAKVNSGTGPNQIVKLDGTSKLPAVDGSALTNVNDATKLPLAGGTMSGAIAMGASDITNVGNLMMANSKVLGLSSNAVDPGSPAIGQMWYNSTSNTIKYYDGAVKTLGTSGAGLQSLNGLTDNVQTFATSTAGATFGFTSATGVHTLNIPIATASKDGLLSQTDFATFNGKLGAVSNTAPLADTKVWIGDGTGKAQERSISGAITVDNTGVATLATVSIAKGGTGQVTKTAAYNALSPMTTKGDITVHNGTDAVRLAVGSDGKALVADSASAEGVKWGDIFATDLANITGLGIVQKTAAGTYVTLGTTAPLSVTAGNITLSQLVNADISATAAIARTKLANGTANHVVINDGTGVMSSEAQLAISRGGTGIGTAPTADQVLVGNASSGYDLKTLTAGTGVTISTAGSAVTINATATAPADSAYDTKGVVGFQTDAATSGMVYSSAGIAKVNTGTGPNQIVKLDGTSKLPAVDGSALTNVNDATKLPLAGGTMSGAIAMGANDITNVGNIMMANSKVLGLSSNAVDPGSPAVGQMWYNSTSNTIKYYDGAVKTLGVSGSGVQSLGGLTDNVQTFATSTAGATFGFTSATGVHTLNIPIATASKDGLLSQTDFATFNSKLGAVSNTAPLADGKVWIGDGTGKAQEQTLSGDVTVSNTGVATLATVSIAKGGTGQTTKTTAFNALSPMTTKGDITVRNGTDAVRLAVGADGKSLIADSASAEGVKWGDVVATDLANITGLGIVQKTAAGTYVTLGTTAPLAVTAGNITLSPLVNADISATAAIARTKLANGTANHVLINDGSGVMSSEAQLAISRGGTGIGTAPTADQVLVGNASSGYDLKTLTAGTGVTISTAGSAVTINATATAPADSAYDTKGIVGFQTDAATSGMVYSSAGIAKVNSGTGPNQIVKLDGTSKLPAVDGSALTNVNDTTKLPLAGGTMTGNIAMGAHDITNVGNIMMANSKVLGLSSNATDPASPSVGQMWYNSTSNTIKYYDGAVKTLGVSGSGLQSLNGETAGTQTFATSTAGATFGFTSATGVHTLNIPIATASKDGLLSQTDFATFNGKLSAVSNTAALADGKIWIGDGTGKAQEQTLSGDVTVSNTGVATIGTVSIAKGGTGQTTKTAAFNALSPLTTKGDIAVRNGTDVVRLAVGADGKALIADSASAEGVKWGDIYATDLANITGLGIVQKTAAGTYTTLGTTAPLSVTGGNIALSPLANADISATAAIARTKIANGTANRMVVNDASGVMSDAAAITANRALISDANGIPTHSAVTNTELGYLSGVTSAVQTQIDSKVSKAGDTMTGNLVMNAQKEVRLMDSGSTHYMGLRSPATVTADKTLTLPDGDGTVGQVLKTDGAGNLGWVSQAAAPGNASYVAKGLVQFDTDAATSGITVASGVASVSRTTAAAASTILQLDASSKAMVKGLDLKGTSNSVSILPTAGTAAYSLTLPAAQGGASTVLQNDGAGNMSWVNALTSVNSAAIVDGSIMDVDINAAAAIARTKLANGTANRVVVNNGSGVMSDAAAITANSALISDANGIPTQSAVTATELGYLTGVTSSVQTQLTAKVAKAGDAMTGALTMNAQNEVRFADSDSSNYVGFKSPATVTTNKVWTLPAADGTSGQLLKTDGAGVLSWITGGVGDFMADGSVAMTGTLKLPVGTAALPSLTFTGDTNTGIYHSAADEVSISTGGTQRMVVDASGNVAIGTASTTNTLEVQGGTATGSTSGKSITLAAQGGGASGAVGGNINLTPGPGGGGWPNGQVIIDVSGSTRKALLINRSGTDGYTSTSASATIPENNTYLSNGWNADGNSALLGFGVYNGNSRSQEAYIGAVSVTGAGVYTPAIVFGRSTSTSSYAESMRIDQSGNLGVGTTAPGAKLDVKGAIRMSGSTSGYTGFQPAAAAGSTVWTLPAADGTAGYALKTDGAGNLGWAAIPGAVVDSSYAAKGIVRFDTDAATSGITIASGLASVNRTTAAAASTILQLDASSKAMVKGLDLKGATSGSSVTLSPDTNTAAYSLTLPAAQGGANTVLQNNGSGVLSWVTALTSVNSAAIVDGSIVDADINASAAIARTKLASGTANHVLINDASGVMSSEAQLLVSRGGTGSASFTANGLVMAGTTSTSALASITCAATGRMLEWTGTTWGCSADFLSSGSPGSKVNYVLMTGGATGTGASIAATGTDSNVNLLLSAKGTGTVQTTSVLYVNGTYVERAPANVATTGTVNVLATANLSRHILTNATLTTLNLPTCPASSVTDTSFSLTIKVTQSAAGTGTLAWSTASGTIEWDSSTEPPMTTTANKSAIYQFLCYNGDTAWYGMQVWKQ